MDTPQPGLHLAQQRQLFFFRPGEAARGLPRWQFGLFNTGLAGATLTYPVAGMSWRWRHCHHQYMNVTLDSFTTEAIFKEVEAMMMNAPEECLPNEALWSDVTEKANGITRDRATSTLCLTFSILELSTNTTSCYFAMKEDSPVLLNSIVYRVVNGLLAPYLGLYPI
ncbi:MAG: hypothetical protein NVS3B3_16190 [Aquirhabdus sp.]